MKTCTKCKKDLPDSNFAGRSDKKVYTLQPYCRDCQKEYKREHYLKNKQKYVDNAKKYTQSVVDWFLEKKKELKCSNCGDERYWVLDFHHVDPKEKDSNISELIRKGSKDRILNELSKCEILCSNCHRDFHHKQVTHK